MSSLLPEINLHQTATISDAIFLLERELFHISQKGYRECRVIHGIGTGTLAKAVHESLTKSPMIKSWAEEENGGSCVVSL